MAQAKLTLKNGTSVDISGTPEEIKRLLDFYDIAPETTEGRGANLGSLKVRSHDKSKGVSKISIHEIVNCIKDARNFEMIEKEILDKTNGLNRILMPLYFVEKHFKSDKGLTSGEISRALKELGAPISISNVSTLLSGSASKYVMGDATRIKGRAIAYRANRRGINQFELVINNKVS